MEKYQKWGITYDNLMDLRTLGLIDMSMGVAAGYDIGNGKEAAKVKYFDLEYQFNHPKKVNVGNVVFTKSGVALQRMVQARKIEEFWEKLCLPLFKRHDV